MELSFNEWAVEGFLVRRDPSSKKSSDEYFTVEKINIGDKLKQGFKEFLIGYLCKENKFSLDLKEFKEYMSDDSKEKKYKISKGDIHKQNGYFEKLMTLISEEKSEAKLADKNFSKYHSIILKFSKGEQELFYCRKLSRVKLGKRKFSIHKGKVEEIDSDFIYFDEFIDFIYFKKFTIEGNTDKERNVFNDEIIIFNRDNFKTLFRLYEVYIQRAGEFFDKFKFIDVANIDTEKKDSSGKFLKLKETFIHDNVLNEQIARIKTLHEDEISFDKIKNLKTKRGKKYGFKIEGSKIKIEDKKQMRDLLDLIDEKIAIPDWDDKKILRYASKGEDL